MLLRSYAWEMHPGSVGKHLHIEWTTWFGFLLKIQGFLRQNIISYLRPVHPGKIKAGSLLYGKGIFVLQIT